MMGATQKDGRRSQLRRHALLRRGMANPFVQSLASNFEEALRLMEAAITDCPDQMWETDLWPDEAPTGPAPHGGLHGSAPWFLVYHALSTLDYDLSAEFEPWEPPQPFDENTYAFPNRMFTKAELLGYIGYGRRRVSATLDALTEDAAGRPLPDTHRYRGMPYGVLVGGIPLHVLEHASQIRQFLTAAGIRVQPMPGVVRTWGEPSTVSGSYVQAAESDPMVPQCAILPAVWDGL